MDLAKYFTELSQDYVIFGWFSTNLLEKCFSKLRQGSGGTYFITSQYVIKKLRIQGAKLSLQLKMEIEGDDGHHCSICNRCRDKNEQETVDSLVSSENMSAFVDIAGCVQMKAGSEIVDNNFYCEKYGDFGNFKVKVALLIL